MTKSLKRNRLWLIPMCLGAIIPPIVWFFGFRDAIVPGTKYKRSLFHETAQSFRIDENDLIVLQRVEDKMVDKKPPSEADWMQVKSFATGTNERMRSFALRTVSRMSRFGHRQQCLDLVQTILHNPSVQNNDGVVSSCLSTLYEMRAPSMQEELDKYRNSKGRFTSFVVEQIQQKEAGKK